MRALSIAVALSLLLVSGHVSHAQPCALDANSCRLPWDWIGYDFIDVYIHPDLAENLRHANGTAWTDLEIAREVQYVIETFNDNMPSGMPPLRYMGQSSGGSQYSRVANAVNINPDLRECDPQELDPGDDICSCMAPGSVDDDYYPADGMLLRMKRSGTGYLTSVGGQMNLDNCTLDKWERFRPSWDGVHQVRGTLNHEFMHILGVNHYGALECPDCTCLSDPEPYKAACSITYEEEWVDQFQNPYAWDVELVKHIYGLYTSASSYRRWRQGSNTGLSWWTQPDLSMPYLAPVLDASSSTGTGTVLLSGRDRSTLKPKAWRVTTADSWLYLGDSVHTSPTMGRAGVADDSVGTWNAYLAFLHGENLINTLKPIRLLTRTLSVSWGLPLDIDDVLVRSQGVDIAHDPRTDFKIFAWRDEYEQVVLGYLSSGTTLGSIVTLNGQFAGEAPTVTCGPASLPYNCIVAWSYSPTGAGTRTMRWAHFQFFSFFGGWAFLISDVMEGPYVSYGAVNVAYGGGTSCPFIFAWKNPGTGQFTRCKGSGASDPMTANTEVLHSWTGRVFSPTVGGGINSEYNLWNVRK